MYERPPERDDLDALLDPLIRFAQEMLRKRGAFYPFGDVMTIDGEVTLTAADPGTDHPPTEEMMDLLLAGMRTQAAAGQIRAAGLCYDVRIRDRDGNATDAIAVSLEHKAGDTARVLMPYSKGRFRGLKFGDIAAERAERRVFDVE
ncbi:MAG TPA: hypothetical protein VGK42_07690 [Candidatus Dormibacteraeota bacterium]|jgi:hypothetical protein